jgi:uncharacterized tellurite resistance protein B-like protein
VTSQRKLETAEQLKTAMLEAIQDFFEQYTGPPSEASAPAVSDRQLQLATAVLALEMARADREIKVDECRAAVRAVERALGIQADEATRLIRLAEEELQLSKPIHDFTRLVDERFSREQKKRLVESLWRVAFSDAELRAHEEYLVRKVADLIHLPFEDFLGAKIDAREAFLKDGA